MFEGVKQVHFVGIGGIGVSALAKFCVHRGMAVSGSDLNHSATIDELARLGAVVTLGHAAEAVKPNVELLIYSPAVPDTNPERATARERGITQMSYPEALGELSKEYSTIAVCGTNGKSTTTAMLGLILEAAGYDPTVIVGTKVPAFKDGNLRMGKGRFLVVEACEYREHFFHLNPEMIVVTNIEEDHLDYFRDLAHIREAFQKFVDKVRGKGMVIWNANDAVSRTLATDRGISFAWEHAAGYTGRNRRPAPGEQTFEVFRTEGFEELLGDETLAVPGLFNVMNALAATSAAAELGVPFETIARALQSFQGTWRRFERVGDWLGADVYSDYGHHPTAIEQTLIAAREFFPGRRIVLCFQPHQHERTKTLFDGFVSALAGADALVVSEIFAVAGRTEVENISSKDLVTAINKKNLENKARYARDLAEAETILRDLVQPTDVLIFQGAGDVDTLARRIAV